MNEASKFLDQTLHVGLNESLESVVDLRSALPAGLEVQFSADRALPGEPAFFMRSSLAPRLERVIRSLRDLAIGLRIEYAYRSPELQAKLCSSDEVLRRVLDRVRWEAGSTKPSMDLVYDRLIVLCANVYKFATHIAAAAVDVTAIDLDTGNEIDRGGPFLDMSERTPMASPFISSAARRNRALIRAVFQEAGFRAYPYEFWHFCAGDVYEVVLTGNHLEARFGPVTIDSGTGRVTAIADVLGEIIPRDTLIERIRTSLAS